MKRASLTLVLRCSLVLVTGWAGWHLGVAVDDTTYASVARQARLALPLPPPPPSGWSRRASKPKPRFPEDELAARAFADPKAAVAEVMAQPAGSARNTRIVSLLRGWVARDPLAAAEWLAGLSPSETPELPFALIEPIFYKASYEATAKGLLGFLAARAGSSLLALASEGPVRTQFRGWIQKDHELAHRLHTLTSSFATWSVCRPSEAIDWVRSLPNPEARRWLLGEAVGALAKNGAAAEAIAFFNAEPELHETGAVRLLGEGWAQADPTAALAWAGQLQDTALRDAFLGAALRAIPGGQAPAALAVTAQVADPVERLALRETLFATALWNRAAVGRWIDSDTSLGESERLEWRQKLER